MPPQPPQPAVDDDVLGAPLPPAVEVFITDAVADPLAAGHGGCRRNRTPFRLHCTPLPLSLSLTALAAELLVVAASPAAAAAGSGEQWATATGRATTPSNLGEETEHVEPMCGFAPQANSFFHDAARVSTCDQW
ncbi:hypothetical protein OsJ_23849 [Oryza sativa Japonica Group]|uniref:Uncharacterized protein n=1 Tax=Oryza sativa subsp. japonica TaxID=39947 RepID=B9FWN1_ORYSJ|nr:hypothetical protein OsJ_23849 [Oryza sativa Japonica Group]